LNTGEVIALTYPKTAEASLYLDPGFRLRRPFPENKTLRLKNGDCVEIRLTGSRLSFVKTAADPVERFTYKARLQKVIDGDTLWVNIDTGLGMWIEQKLRLRAINCPEINTAQGQRARRFVQDRLKGLEWIIVKTHKDTTDKYDRYLADVFCLSGERDPEKIALKGRFLNQELLDAGLATMYS
jgi:endonuclease YncB( thermonuclease family)